MKKIIIALAITLSACTEAEKKHNALPIVYDINGGSHSSLRIYVIDSCEYIGRITGSTADAITHKGNCKFCAKRKVNITESQ